MAGTVNEARNVRVEAFPTAVPASREAEERLLGACLVEGDNGQTFARLQSEGITSATYYHPENQIIWLAMSALQNEGEPLAIETLLARLLRTGDLERISGGTNYLLQVTDKAPTTVYVATHLEEVKRCELLRRLRRATTDTGEKLANFTGTLADAEELAANFSAELAPAPARSKEKELRFLDLLKVDPAHDPDCLIGNRYLGRTNAVLVVAQSGIGKSVLSVQLGILASCGRPLFGLRIHKPLRVLYVQAEDDVGDVAEAVQGVDRNYALTAEQHDMVQKNFRAVRWNDVIGSRFIARLQAEFARWPFDLVIINPLFSFAGCDLIDQSQAGDFLRHQLNSFLTRTRCAAVVVHHTKKPPSDPANDSNEDTASYDGYGSSDLTNWARATISLQLVRGTGGKVCRMVFGKRKNRTGLIDDNGNTKTTLLIEHSPNGLCWVPSDYRPERESASGQFKANKWDLDRAKQVYRKGLPWPENKRAIADELGMTPQGVEKHKNKLEPVP